MAFILKFFFLSAMTLSVTETNIYVVEFV